MVKRNPCKGNSKYRGLPAGLPGTQSWRSHSRAHGWTAGPEQLSSGQRQVQLTHGWNHPPATQGSIMPWRVDLPVWNQVLALVGPGWQRNAMAPFDSEMRGYKRKSEVLFPNPCEKYQARFHGNWVCRFSKQCSHHITCWIWFNQWCLLSKKRTLAFKNSAFERICWCRWR